MDQIYDIVIVGLGPAGATFARLISPEYKVLAIDKKSLQKNSFRKPCGGLLAPNSLKILAKLGLGLSKDLFVNPQIFCVKTIDSHKKITKYYRRFYLNLDRHRFDTWLRSLISEKIEIVDNSICNSISYLNGLYYLTYTCMGISKTIICKYIVAGDGANSFIRRKMKPKFKMRKYLCIQEHYQALEKEPYYISIFDKKITDCYSWGLYKDNHFILGGAFPIKKGKERFANLQAKMTDHDLSQPLYKEACLVLRPQLFSSFCKAHKGIFYLGEAAGFISPSSLEGISYGMESGYLLSEVFNKNLQNKEKKYNKMTKKIRLSLKLKLLKCPFMYNPFLRFLVMKSGIGTIKVNKK